MELPEMEQQPLAWKKWSKRFGLIFALPIFFVLAILLWAGFRVATHSQVDDDIHLEAKTEYLKSIAASQSASVGNQTDDRPNIIFILYDDLGYGDLGFTGSSAIQTPAIDSLASNGVVLTNFYSPSPICSPSRAGFMTGRHAPRAGLPNVVFPTGSSKSLLNLLNDEPIRLPAEEITVADMLQAVGYSTGMIGKWHMGDTEPSLPQNFGFDQYFGALYSNDMEPFALYRNKEIAVKAPVDQTKLDEIYTREAVDFIKDQSGQKKPFFLYFAHNFPHIPLYVSSERAGRSNAGLYGDVVETLDSGVAKIVAALKEQDMLDNTIIILSSDNGPWYEGSSGFSRGRKGQTWDGGMHVPFLMHWPAGLEGGREVDGISMGMDLLPTLADLLDIPLPTDRFIDGKSILAMIENGVETPHEELYYFANEKLMAVRDSKFKYLAERTHLYQPNDGGIGLPVKHGPWLIDMSRDPDESYNVSGRYPDQTKMMREKLAAKRSEMESNKRGWIEK
ncbi:MAG: hypothetical protein Pars2KO_17670 [Parasphingorhabdus sp.]